MSQLIDDANATATVAAAVLLPLLVTLLLNDGSLVTASATGNAAATVSQGQHGDRTVDRAGPSVLTPYLPLCLSAPLSTKSGRLRKTGSAWLRTVDGAGHARVGVQSINNQMNNIKSE